MLAALAAAVGLLVGSFLGTLVLRPPQGKAVLTGRSACPFCGRQLGAVEMIPLASWLLQRRRCRGCHARLSAFYPAVELAGALVAGLSFALLVWPWSGLVTLLGWGLIVGVARVVVGTRNL